MWCFLDNFFFMLSVLVPQKKLANYCCHILKFRLNLYYRNYSNTMYAKKIISILTFAQFSGKGRQSLH